MYTEARLGQLWQVLTPPLNSAVYYLIFGSLFLPFACLAAGLAFAPARVPPPPELVPESRDDLTSQVPGQVG